MNFISGFLGLCTVVGAGTASEVSASGYARQPIAFAMPVSGVSVNVRPWDFGLVNESPPIVGRAVYDAPTGGNLLLVLPHAAARAPSGGSTDRGDGGDITLNITAFASYPDGGAFNGNFAAGASLGICYDKAEIVGWASTQPNAVSGVTVLSRGGLYLQVQASTLTTGAGLTITRGMAVAA